MSILGTIRNRHRHRTTDRRASRDLARALASAPTRASREELLLLQNR